MNRVLKNYDYNVMSKYGMRTVNGKQKMHNGIDITAIKNGKNDVDGIVAHSDGVVVAIATGKSNNKGSTGLESYGNYVKIKHKNGYYTLYAHLKKVYVEKSQTVTKGQEIGFMGNTGNSYGAHLHFEVRNQYDKRIDPTYYLDNDLPKYVSVPVKKIEQTVVAGQKFLNDNYADRCGFELLELDGSFGKKSLKAWVMAVQYELNCLGANLEIDGSFGKLSQTAWKEIVSSLRRGDRNILVELWQIRLVGAKYDPNGIDGSFGGGCEFATKEYQRDSQLKIDGYVGKNTMKKANGK